MANMTNLLSSFPSDFRALIFGARGGLGAAFVDALEQRCQVTGMTRADIDICDEAALAALADREKAHGPLHLIINATGLLHDAAADIRPEKALQQITAAVMAEVLAVNTIGPALIAKYFLPLLAREEKAVMAHLSARVGSISDNRMGGWTSYRAAKAAQNMVVKNAAIETARRDKQKIIIGLHPGTVDSDLSAPFQANVAADKLFTPMQSVDYLLHVIDGLAPQDSGKVFAWDGQEVPA
ncbi:MAG: C-factor [Alphaproteobacteria bacterium]|nr:MAG: C-factor [Alphaproteobacteria bacterium]